MLKLILIKIKSDSFELESLILFFFFFTKVLSPTLYVLFYSVVDLILKTLVMTKE